MAIVASEAAAAESGVVASNEATSSTTDTAAALSEAIACGSKHGGVGRGKWTRVAISSEMESAGVIDVVKLRWEIITSAVKCAVRLIVSRSD
jgi:hypothetical protein